MFRQCKIKLVQDDGKGTFTTTYLPKKYAVLGKVISIKNEGTWTRGWKVVSVGHETDDPPNWRKAIKHHRSSTGDSIKKP